MDAGAWFPDDGDFTVGVFFCDVFHELCIGGEKLRTTQILQIAGAGANKKWRCNCLLHRHRRGCRTPLGCFHQLNLAEELHVLAHQHAASFEGSVPVQAPFLAVDFTRKGEARLGVAPGVYANASEFCL